MGFVGVYRAIYDYSPTGDTELAISDGDLLFVLDKPTDDDWWRAKKKATEDEDEEPEGLIPNNYVEEAQPIHQAKALYDYSRQTDEELSFTEDATLDVYDTTDPDWTLVGLDNDFGFVPANYIEEIEAAPPKPARPQSTDHGAKTRSPSASVSSPVAQTPAAALAGIIQQKTGSATAESARATQQYTPEASDEEQPAPSLPRRPASGQISPPAAQPQSPRTPEAQGVMASLPGDDVENGLTSPRGYHLYNIHEMISHMGKNKKMPTTLGINIAKGIIMIAPEKSRDGPQQRWSAEKLTHYSLEGKHVFMELVRPSKSIDFHAGAKDTAQEIVSALGELAGAVRAEGLKEVWAAGAGSSGQKKGHMLYEFMAQGDDEVTVAVDDEVVVLDDTQSEEWWMVRRLKNGKEGVVPSSYVEVTGTVSPAIEDPPKSAKSTKSTVEQNRREEERLSRAAVERDSNQSRKKDKKEEKKKKDEAADMPNSRRVRVWTDRSGDFKVDAEFLGLKDGKLHLHKTNGVKIAVPVHRMSVEDLEYVEGITGVSLDEDKPLSDVKRRSTQKRQEKERQSSLANSRSGAAIERTEPKYDWFDFFLQCGVNPQICERYSSAFERDQMGEENMEDIDPTLLRTLGLKEGDVLRVMKFLDTKFGRSREKRQQDADGESGSGDGLFSGPGGALRNNTRKGRPAPAVQSNDTVDPRAFEQDAIKKEAPPDSKPTPLTSAPQPQRKATSGFDDNAWDVKPSKKATPPKSASPSSDVGPPPPPKPTISGAASDLSLLSPPLQPTPAPQPTQQVPQTQSQSPSLPTTQAQDQGPSQPTGANRQFFDQLGAPGAIPQQNQQSSLPRQRPQAPPQQQNQNSFLPPPPRSMSAPHNNQPSAFGPPPLQPQMTGYQSQIAPPGQSLNDLNQQRFQQPQTNQQPIQSQPTGYGNFNQGPNGFNQYQQQQPQQPQQAPQQYPQPTGFYPQNQQHFQPHSQQQQFINGQQTGSPFADPPRQPFQPLQPQQTGYNPNFSSPPPQLPQQTGINNFLQPSLHPQPTGFGNNQSSGMNGFGMNNQQHLQSPPPVPPIPQQQTGIQPLRPQKTGPAPAVRFGSQSAQKLTPQPTGRANLANATPQNPFGF